tara:strand:+ start:70 stop:345 length:276 start_codon:yes stop_codon:yes gene_type:complete
MKTNNSLLKMTIGIFAILIITNMILNTNSTLEGLSLQDVNTLSGDLDSLINNVENKQKIYNEDFKQIDDSMNSENAALQSESNAVTKDMMS